MTAAELAALPEAIWKKRHIKVGVDSWEVIDREEFLLCLREYGQAVRKRDAEICLQQRKGVIQFNTAQKCAAAIEQEKLP